MMMRPRRYGMVNRSVARAVTYSHRGKSATHFTSEDGWIFLIIFIVLIIAFATGSK